MALGELVGYQIAVALILLVALLAANGGRLRRIPGPLITAYSPLPLLYQDYRSSRTLWIRGLHDEYGPVVRVSPTEVSISSPKAMKDVYASHTFFAKSTVYRLFDRYNVSNSFSTISAKGHSWRRQALAPAYQQTTILTKEARTGGMWRIANDFLQYLEREGEPVVDGKRRGRSADVYRMSQYYTVDTMTQHLFLWSSQVLKGNRRIRHFLDDAARSPPLAFTNMAVILLPYFSLERCLRRLDKKMEELFCHSWNAMVRFLRRGSSLKGRKFEQSTAEPYCGQRQLASYAYDQCIAAREAVESTYQWPDNCAEAPVSVILTGHVLDSEERPPGGSSKNLETLSATYQSNVEAASECLHQLATAIDTTADTLACAIFSLAAPGAQDFQRELRQEVEDLRMPIDPNTPLDSDTLSCIVHAPFLEAVLQETLRLFPPRCSSMPRVVPAGGFVVDGYHIPGGCTVGATPAVLNNDSTVFDRGGKHDVKQWHPERWLDSEFLPVMRRRLWTFGSGERGCIAEFFARLQIKLCLVAIYSRYETHEDADASVPAIYQYARRTFRDVDYFPGHNGIVRFVRT